MGAKAMKKQQKILMKKTLREAIEKIIIQTNELKNKVHDIENNREDHSLTKEEVFSIGQSINASTAVANYLSGLLDGLDLPNKPKKELDKFIEDLQKVGVNKVEPPNYVR